MVELIKIEFLLEAKTAISHGDKTVGNEQLIRREPVEQLDGSIEEVPCISGNSARHKMREAGSHALLEAAGLLDMPLSKQAMLLMTNGGVQGGSGSTIKLDEYRELISLLPHIALLGGATQNRVQQGQGSAEYMTLVCSENARRISPWILEHAEQHGRKIGSCYDRINLVHEVRGDALLSPGNRRRLLPAAREEAELRLSRSESASEMDDDAEKDRAKSDMMPYSFETVIAGTWWQWGASFTCYDELDRDMLYVMLASFMANCRVGGKARSGHGLMEPIAARNIELPRWKPLANPVDVAALAGRPGNVFRAHVAERREKIRQVLESIQDRPVKPGKGRQTEEQDA